MKRGKGKPWVEPETRHSHPSGPRRPSHRTTYRFSLEPCTLETKLVNSQTWYHLKLGSPQMAGVDSRFPFQRAVLRSSALQNTRPTSSGVSAEHQPVFRLQARELCRWPMACDPRSSRIPPLCRGTYFNKRGAGGKHRNSPIPPYPGGSIYLYGG